MMSIFTFVGIFLALPTGGFAQKWGPKNMVVLAAVLVAAGSIIGATANSGGMMIFSRGIEGVGFIFVTVCGPMAIAKYVEPSKLGSAMGIWAVWVNVGQILGNNLTPPLYDLMGLSGVWTTYAVVALVLGLVVLVFIKAPQQQVVVADSAASNANMGEAFKNQNLWLLCLSFLIFNIILLSVLAFAPTFLTSNGMSVAAAGFATSLPMILGLVASPVFGKISDMIGSTKNLYLVALFAMGPAAIMMFSSTGILMYLGAILLGLIGMGSPVMVLSSMGKVNPQPELAGTGMGLLMTCQGVGMFLGSMVMPYFLQFTGTWTLASWLLLPITIIGVVLAALAKFK